MNVELKKNLTVTSSESIFELMKVILMREEEKDHGVLWVIGLASNNGIIYMEQLRLESMNELKMQPMQVFRVGVLKRAAKMVLVHHHRTGSDVLPYDLFPSEVDNDITDRLLQVGRILKIKVIDHLIISPDHYYSYKDSGLLAALEKSEKYILPDLEKKRKYKKQGKSKVI